MLDIIVLTRVTCELIIATGNAQAPKIVQEKADEFMALSNAAEGKIAECIKTIQNSPNAVTPSQMILKVRTLNETIIGMMMIVKRAVDAYLDQPDSLNQRQPSTM